MKKNNPSDAARALAQARWSGATPQERTATARHAAKAQRTDKRCFCGASSMWRAANRYFDCCRKAGVVVLNLEARPADE